MKDLGICILTLKSKEKVLACQDSLFKTTRDLDLDVVVADNHSQDGTVEEIRAQYPGVRLILSDDNLGYSKAVNQGLRTLDAHYYVLLNPDTIVVDMAFNHLIQFV